MSVDEEWLKATSMSDHLSTTLSKRQMHLKLAHFNRRRLDPKIPSSFWREEIIHEEVYRTLEHQMLELEITEIAPMTDAISHLSLTGKQFVEWFEALKEIGPGQHDTLFDYLEHDADIDQFRWFIRQEVAGEAGFDDLAALTQIKMPVRAKLEIARNYWDEMGRGNERGMHGPMLSKLAEELDIHSSEIDDIVPEALALANLLIGFAVNRNYAYHSLGALGAVELTAPHRALKVHGGLKRLGLSGTAQRYYLLHSTIDLKHSVDWNREVIAPIIDRCPELALPIAEGALARLEAGARCYLRYREEFQLEIGALNAHFIN